MISLFAGLRPRWIDGWPTLSIHSLDQSHIDARYGIFQPRGEISKAAVNFSVGDGEVNLLREFHLFAKQKL